MLLLSLRSAQGFYFPVLSRIENCQYLFFFPPHLQRIYPCAITADWILPFQAPSCAAWMLTPACLPILNALQGHVFIQANLNCTSLQMFHFKTTTTKNPHLKMPQNLNPPCPPSSQSLACSPVEWHVCHEKGCSWTGINFGLSWEFQVLGCTSSPGISPLFWHGRTLFSVFTFGSLRCFILINFFQPPSAENNKKNVLS